MDRKDLAGPGRVRVVPPSDPGARALVAVGSPVAGIDLRIVGESGERLPDDALGEIQIRGAAVTDGYRGDAEATASAFDGEWLRTGDLGFVNDGSLFIAGRIKDMIIVNGENHFAEDVEFLVRDMPGVFRRRCVAIPEAAEYMTVVVETRDPDEGFAERVRAKIAADLGLTAVRVRVTRPGTLPSTTSGKWQRSRAGEIIRRAAR